MKPDAVPSLLLFFATRTRTLLANLLWDTSQHSAPKMDRREKEVLRGEGIRSNPVITALSFEVSEVCEIRFGLLRLRRRCRGASR